MKPAARVTAAIRGPLASGVAALLLLLSVGAPASAQGDPPARFRLFLNGAATTGSITYSEARRYEQFGAQSIQNAEYTSDPTAGFEAGGQVRLWKNLGAAVSFARFDRKGSAEVRTRLPLPAALGGSAEVAAQGSGFPVKEDAVHVDLVYSRRWRELEIGAFAGLTRSSVEAELARLTTSLTFSSPERPPSVVAGAVPRSSFSASGTGFNVGGSVDLVLGTFGLGVQLRYSRSTLSVAVPSDERFDSGSLEITPGGLQLAGGLRVFF